MKRNSLLLSALLLSSVCVSAQTKPSEKPLNPQSNDRGTQINYSKLLRERTELVEKLTIVVQTSQDHEWQGSKDSAIRLLGVMRAPEAVRVLADNLLFLPTDIALREPLPTQFYYSSAWALAQIGKPAVNAMEVKIIQSSSLEERQLAAWVIMEIEGKEQAMGRLQKRINESPTVDNRTQQLQEAMDYLKDFKATYFPPGMEAAMTQLEPTVLPQ